MHTLEANTTLIGTLLCEILEMPVGPAILGGRADMQKKKTFQFNCNS